jgi:hypothetical protein
MKLKGTYKQAYTIDKEAKELVVEVELKQIEGMMKPGQNVWYGVAIANGKEIKHKSLPYCVNAEYMAETIGLEIIESWKIRAKKEGKVFKLKKEKNETKRI